MAVSQVQVPGHTWSKYPLKQTRNDAEARLGVLLVDYSILTSKLPFPRGSDE